MPAWTSLEETAVCVVDEGGRIVRETRVASEPTALIAFFNQLDLPLERIGLEACSLSAWLHEGMTEAGLPALCIETRQARAVMKTMPNKTDRNDARGLAQMMRTGWYRVVHVKSAPSRSWRALLVARRTVLNKMRDMENGVRALLREAGLKLGTPSRKDFAARVRDLAGEDPVLKPLVTSLLAIIATMVRELAQLTKRILAIVRDEPVCRQLMTAPGVGPLTALAFRATIVRWCCGRHDLPLPLERTGRPGWPPRLRSHVRLLGTLRRGSGHEGRQPHPYACRVCR